MQSVLSFPFRATFNGFNILCSVHRLHIVPTTPHLGHLVLGHVGELEEGVEPGGGGRLGHLAPHQVVLLLDEELVMRHPGDGRGQ